MRAGPLDWALRFPAWSYRDRAPLMSSNIGDKVVAPSLLVVERGRECVLPYSTLRPWSGCLPVCVSVSASKLPFVAGSGIFE